jgi:hypothetical protein
MILMAWTGDERRTKNQSSNANPGVNPRRSAIRYAAAATRECRSSAVRGCRVSASRSMA